MSKICRENDLNRSSRGTESGITILFTNKINIYL